MIVSERAAGNLGDLENMNAAKRALMRGDHNAHVYDRHKWFVDQNGLMKTVLSNHNVRITPPPKSKVVPISSVVDHPLFFKAVPEARNWTAAVRDLPGPIGGMANPWTRHITVASRQANSKSTWLHELTHAGQKEQGLPRNNRGTNPIAAGGFARYHNQLGEVEARLSGANAPASQKARALMARAQANGVRRPAIKPLTAPTKPKMPDRKKPVSIPSAHRKR